MDNSRDFLSLVEQIKEFKQLLDAGVLTQEEYDAKKSELLGVTAGASLSGDVCGPVQTAEAMAVLPNGENEGEGVAASSASDARGGRVALKPEIEKQGGELPGKAALDDLKSYKYLLDEGVLTEAEFGKKKREILGIKTDEEEAAQVKKAVVRSWILTFVAVFVCVFGLAFSIIAFIFPYASGSLHLLVLAVAVVVFFVSLMLVYRQVGKR